MIRILATTLLLLSFAPPAAAADCIVFPQGVTHGPRGAAKAWSVVVSGDRIVAAEASPKGLVLTADSATWQGSPCTLLVLPGGSELAPGFIEVDSRLGLVEVDLEARTRHHDAGGAPIRTAHQVADSYDPLTSTIPVARRGGITAAVITPAGGRISGQSAWVELTGDTQARAVLNPSVAMPASISGASPAAGMNALSEFFEDARVFERDRRAFDQNRSRSLSASRADLEAIQPVLRGDIPLVIGVDRAAHIEALIRFAAAEKVRIVIRGGAEAWRHRDALAAAKIPVMLDPTVYGAGSFSQREARADGVKLLAEAGVEILFFSTYHSSHFARILPQLAGNAVRAGLPHAAAMRALTAAPATVFGRTDSGLIAAGMRANLVLWSGDPLELSSRPLRMWIAGEEQSLESRQTQLRDRYMQATEASD
jgi:imidazolonepropionase-like amidohydrolase